MRQAWRKVVKAFRLSAVPLYRRGLGIGVGAAIEHEAILAFLTQSGISDVVDVGANRGQFSLLCRRWLPDARIVAFEPVTEPARTFRRLFAPDPKTQLFLSAVGAASAEMDMHISKAVDSSSLLPIGKAQSQVFPGTEESHLLRVRVAPLDAFIGKEQISERSLLKIDVQGYELEVLRGCVRLLDRFMAIYVECSFIELYEGQALADEVVNWLHEHGFHLARIGILTFDQNGMSVQGDLLFLRRDVGIAQR